MGATYRCGNEVHHYTNQDFDRIGRQALTRLVAAMEKINNKEESAVEMTVSEVEGLIIKEFLDNRFWSILENNGMLEVPTVRGSNAIVRKAVGHPNHYLVTAA